MKWRIAKTVRMPEARDKHEAEQQAVGGVAERLIAKHPELDQSYIRELVQAEYEHLQQAKLRDYIPVLVEHAVKQDLKTGRAKGSSDRG